MLESVTHCSVQNAHRMWSQLLSQHICHIKTQPAVSDRDQDLETWPCARSHFGRRAACALQELQRHILSLQNVLSCLCFITAFEQVFFCRFHIFDSCCRLVKTICNKSALQCFSLYQITSKFVRK